MDTNQKAELAWLTRISMTHPNWAIYAEWKAAYRANKDPSYWGWLPEALASSVRQQSSSSSKTPDAPPEMETPGKRHARTRTTA